MLGWFAPVLFYSNRNGELFNNNTDLFNSEWLQNKKLLFQIYLLKFALISELNVEFNTRDSENHNSLQ